mgnify:CR=1 FL=1
MWFDINESLTSEECTRQAEYNQQQMKKIDSEIFNLQKVLYSIPSWDCPEPENVELVNGLADRIENLSNSADNYERQVDYWNTQKYYALLREKSN